MPRSLLRPLTAVLISGAGALGLVVLAAPRPVDSAAPPAETEVPNYPGLAELI